MNIQLTDELRNALRQNPGEPLYIHDEESQKDYVLMESGPMSVAWDSLRRAIDEGAEDIEAGCVSPWDPEEVMRLGRERLARRHQDSANHSKKTNP